MTQTPVLQMIKLHLKTGTTNLTPESIAVDYIETSVFLWDDMFSNSRFVNSPREYDYLCYGIIDHEQSNDKRYEPIWV